jgi:hypothetical protein
VENQLFLDSELLFFKVCQNQLVRVGAVKFNFYATIQVCVLGLE